MPPIEKQFRCQTATLWSYAGVDALGELVVNQPTEIKVRWDETQAETQDKDGNTILVDATAIVGEDIEPGSVMRLGSIDDETQDHLKRVVRCSKTPDLKGRFFQRTVYLVRYSETLPSLLGT